jgi:hypothetical protein
MSPITLPGELVYLLALQQVGRGEETTYQRNKLRGLPISERL